MKIGILSRKASIYSTNSLVEAAKKRGHGHSTKLTDDLISIVGGAPLVIKRIQGSRISGLKFWKTPRLKRTSVKTVKFSGDHKRGSK